MSWRGAAAIAAFVQMFFAAFVYAGAPDASALRARFGTGALYEGVDHARTGATCYVAARAEGPDGPRARARLIAWSEDVAGTIQASQPMEFERDSESWRAVGGAGEAACADGFAVGTAGPSRFEARDVAQGKEWIRRCGGGRAYLRVSSRALMAVRVDDAFRRLPEILEFDALEFHSVGPWTYAPKSNSVRMQCRALRLSKRF